MTPATDQPHEFVELPPERFFWAIFTRADLGLGSHDRLDQVDRGSFRDALADSLLPDLDQLDWAVASLDHDRLVVCLQLREIVQSQISRRVMHFGPASLPEPLAADPRANEAARELNFLRDALTPAPVVMIRRQRAWAAAIAATVLAAIAIAGIEVRRIEASQQQRSASSGTATILADNRAVSVVELRRKADGLRATRLKLDGLVGQNGDQQDAAAALAALLSAWPRDSASMFIQTDSLQVTLDAVTLQFVAPSREDATQLATHLTSFPALDRTGGDLSKAWTLAQPQITTIGSDSAPSAAQPLPERRGAGGLVRGSFRFTKSKSPSSLPTADSRSEASRE